MIRTVLEIDGMMCGMCEAHINDAVRREFKVKKVTSSHKKGITEIISEQAPDKERLTAIITELGYKLNGISDEEYKKKGFFSRK
ncbi:MAG: ATPase P [Ruminococcus sp.]|nr:ATPase P [Ruminococcus sp.]